MYEAILLEEIWPSPDLYFAVNKQQAAFFFLTEDDMLAYIWIKFQ